MAATAVLEGMGEDDVLAFAGDAADRERAAQADQLRGAYQWAVIHSPDRLAGAERPGGERARAYGGDGTPEVTEFAAAALGARMGITTFAAGQLMADALDLHHRSPRLWARVEAGEVKASYARFVVKQTRGLPAEEAAYVDAAVAESADGRIPWTRFEALVEAAIVKANPEVAREQEERAAKATFAKKLRAEAHGMASFLVRGPVPVIEQIAATVESYSTAIADDFPDLDDDQRSVQAVLMLLTPGTDQDPAKLADHAPVVHLYVHTYAGNEPGSGIARLEGHGPVTQDWVRDVLGPTCRFKITPVLNLEGQTPVDAYEIPDRHRQAVHLMTPADTFPYGSSLSRGMDLDHTTPWNPSGPPGQSGLGNYGPMTRTHHRIKTHGGWGVQQPFPGIYLWRGPHGAFYLVDHTGTRQLRGSTDDLPLVVEIYRNLPETRLDLAS
jgi:hypothetical protein